jgi:Secretion system C-terminal sorting domain/Carboxylesterase family
MTATKLSTVLLLAVSIVSSAQNRYQQPVFPQVSSTTVQYGSNFTILPALFGGHSSRQALVMQVYAPVGDVETSRPMIIFLHTGNFFPFPQNSICGGALNDSSNVEIATRLAKMGYVVAVADYRLGWAPFHPQELVRRFFLVNAIYRGIQDVRSCIRFFRQNVAEQGNTFGIDPDKIVVWGQGTGGTLALASAYLDKLEELYTTSDPNKFNLLLPGGIYYPMVQAFYNGDIAGQQAAPGIIDSTYNVITTLPIGDTLFVPNTPGYSSAFNLAVNMSGMLLDSSWMDAGDVPLISFHVPSDYFTPCQTTQIGYWNNSPAPIVEASGSCTMQEIAETLGLNQIFSTIPAGFDPFIGTTVPPWTNTSYAEPWAWTSYSGMPPPLATTMGCGVNGDIARAYIDTIVGFFAPRACVALGLGCNFSSTHEWNGLDIGLQILPVPATDAVTFQTNEAIIRNILVYDLNGRLVRSHHNINSNEFQMQRNSLPNGMYVVALDFDDGVVKCKLVFNG